jgi:hypothetical protein
MRKIKPLIFGTFRCQRPDKTYAFKLPHRLRPPHLSVKELKTNPRLTFHLLQEAISPAEAIHLQMRYVVAHSKALHFQGGTQEIKTLLSKCSI